jgi:hypothetical protein
VNFKGKNIFFKYFLKIAKYGLRFNITENKHRKNKNEVPRYVNRWQDQYTVGGADFSKKFKI